MTKAISFLALVFFLAGFFSCTKETTDAPEVLYGNWKTSYGDTIVFANVNGLSTATYNATQNPTMPNRSSYEFTYRNNTLGIKDWLTNGNDFRFFNTFKWITQGESFQIQGVQWFGFINSTATYFTFTKIH